MYPILFLQISFVRQVFDSNGIFIKEFGQYGSGEGEFDCLAGVAVNRIGQYIIADRYNHRIQVRQTIYNNISRVLSTEYISRVQKSFVGLSIRLYTIPKAVLDLKFPNEAVEFDIS